MYNLKYEKSFLRKVHKIVIVSSEIDKKLDKLLLRLRENPFNPALKTHGLSGNLK